MELTHTFTVPGTVEATWERFGDIAGLAECFPGAQVDSADDTSFTGSCKVKLGPIALVYAGSGLFLEKDESSHRMVVEAKGRDKRGNGTAGAVVTVTMKPGEGDATDVHVLTDLNVTGKPAQFGRGVMQDVSDKLLGQFVACLEQRSRDDHAATPPGGSAGETATAEPVGGSPADPDAGPGSVPVGAAAAGASGNDPDSGPASEPGPAARSGETLGSSTGRHSAEPEALDLGATVLPVLVRSYWKQGLAALVGVVVIVRLLRRVAR